VQIKKCKLARGVKTERCKTRLGCSTRVLILVHLHRVRSKQAKLWHIPGALYCTVSCVTVLVLVTNEKYIMCAAGRNRVTAIFTSPALCTRLVRIFLHVMFPQSINTVTCSKNFMFWGTEFTHTYYKCLH